MNQFARASLRPAVITAVVVATIVGGVIGIGRLADGRAGAARAAGAPRQAAAAPQTAPLPHFNPADDASSLVWMIPLHFTSRSQVTIDPPTMQSGKANIQRTAPPQLQLELYDRAGSKIQSIYAWHPLRLEVESAVRPTPAGPRLAGRQGNAPLQAGSRAYDPYHIIRDSGDGELFLPYDPRASSLRIVDLTLGGQELGRVSLEGAARRYCDQYPLAPACHGGAGGAGSVARSTLYLDPYSVTVGSGAVFTIELKARKMVDLYGGQLAVTFDPRVLQVVDQDPGRPGAQIIPADFPKPDSVLRNAANNSTGRLEYFFTLTGEKPGVSGAGTLAHLVMRGAGPGKSLMAITETVLSDPQSLGIPTKTENALITVLDAPAASVAGQVELERRPTSAGARVCSSGTCVTTDAAGRFKLNNVPVGRPVDVSHPSYLRTQRLLPASATGTVTWPKVKLLSGDLDKDDWVDIVDAVMIGQHFNLKYNPGGPNPRWLEACDITDDDTVNILDMTGVQFNMLKTAPTTWPTFLLARAAGHPASPAETTRVVLLPQAAHADKVNVDIPLELRVENVARLYGYRVRLAFDPTLLKVMDVSPADDGVQVALGEFLDPINSIVLLNRADNDSGILDLSVTQTSPATGTTGSGVLATITFRGRAGGASAVTLPDVVLVDDTEPLPNIITTEKAGATIDVTGGAGGIYLPWTTQKR